jgi:hypothetical protein
MKWERCKRPAGIAGIVLLWTASMVWAHSRGYSDACEFLAPGIPSSAVMQAQSDEWQRQADESREVVLSRLGIRR